MKSEITKFGKILVTGSPGVGKTTLLLKVVRKIGEHHFSGFYTEEMREQGARVGFRAVGLGGHSMVLAHVLFSGPYRVGRYGVDIKAFEKFLIGLDLLHQNGSIIVVDEIGKMECLSMEFQRIISAFFDSQNSIIATVAKKGGGLIQAVKSRPDVTQFEVTPGNRENVFSEILKRIRE